MREITRRMFLKRTGLAGAGALFGESLFRKLAGEGLSWAADDGTAPAIVSVRGEDGFAGAVKAVDHLGGMKAFVGRGDRVGLLVNSPFRNLGASVHPDLTLAVMHMCHEAGAKEIRYLKEPHGGYWERTERSVLYEDLIKRLVPESGDRVKVPVDGGKVLRDVKVSRDLQGCDVFINAAIAKHHRGVHITGTLKNMMGLCPFTTNSYFHFGTLKLGWYGDLDHLSQCIADLNLVRKPDLCLVDATVVLAENGPSGPGRLLKKGMVAASTDRVALDAFCASVHGRKPEDIPMIQKAAMHGLGEMDPARLRVQALEG